MARVQVLLGLILAACGSVNVTYPDGGGNGGGDGGGGGDGPGGPDATNLVTAIVRDGTRSGPPIPGVRVLFHAMDGSIVEEFLTNDAGEATFAAPMGGGVTALLTTTEGVPMAMTVVGVEGGDRIPFIRPLPESSGNAPSNLYVGFQTPAAGVSQVRFDMGCHTQWFPPSPTSVTLDIYEHCLRNGETVSLLATEEGGAAPRFAYVTDVGLGATVTLPPWSSNYERSQVVVDGIPAGTSFLGGSAQMFRNGFGFDSLDVPPIMNPPPGTTQALSFQYVRAFADYFQLSFVVQRTDAPGFQVWVNVTDSPPSTDTVNVTTDIPPPLTSSTFTPAPEPTVTWAGGGGPLDSDAILIALFWGTAGPQGSWLVMAPPALNMLRLPDLPADATQWQPDAGTGQPQVAYINVAGLTMFREIKNMYGPALLRSEPPVGFRGSASLIAGF